MKKILASKSPRRKELLKLIENDFEVIPSTEEEKIDYSKLPEHIVQDLAYMKAKSVFEKTSGDRIVIGSDTIVTKNGKIYGKPKNKQHAKEMIKELCQDDKMHKVMTGVTILIQNKDEYKEYKIYDEVKVYLKNIDDYEIDKWINSGKAMDKAGAYSIQDEFGVFIEKIEGNYTTVVGFPIHKVYDVIKNYR